MRRYSNLSSRLGSRRTSSLRSRLERSPLRRSSRERLSERRPVVEREVIREKPVSINKEIEPLRKEISSLRESLRKPVARTERPIRSRISPIRRSNSETRVLRKELEGLKKELKEKDYNDWSSRYQDKQTREKEVYKKVGIDENDYVPAKRLSSLIKTRYKVDDDTAIKVSKKLIEELDKDASVHDIPKSSIDSSTNSRIGIRARNVESKTKVGTEAEEVRQIAEKFGVEFED